MKLLKLALLPLIIFKSMALSSEMKSHDPEDVRLKYESQIHKRFDGVLSKILPEKTFNLVVNVQLSVEKVNVLVSKKVIKQESAAEAVTQARPGFERENPVITPTEKDSIFEEDFSVQNEINLDSVEFFLVLDESLPESLRELAQSALTSKMEKNFSGKATLRTEISDLLAYDPILTGNYWSNFLQNNLIKLLYLVIGFLLTVMLFFFKLNRRRQIKSEEESNTPRELTQRPSEEKEVTTEDALENLRKSILIAYKKDNESLRTFMGGLNEDNVKIVAKSMTESIFYDEIMRFSDFLILDDLANESYEKEEIEKLNQNLNDYVALHNVSLSTPFGFLNRMSPEVLYENLKDSKEDLALVISFLSDAQVKELLSLIGIGKKAEILSSLTKEDFFDGKAETINELEAKLRAVYEEEKAKVGYDKNSQKNSLDLILNNDQEVALTLEVAKSDHKIALDESYDVFTITFDKAMDIENTKQIKRVFQDLDNNNIIGCLADLGEDKEKAFLDILPPTRQKIIASLKKNLELTDESKADSRQAFLKAYRSIAQETRPVDKKD